ncbi:hypothetical protein [Salmonella enterica]|uniref:hypothetical protein n=1 Tax=Salmonella enterica TaxID=28901 RepID=UPI0003B2BED4|nr:hypothetical protein [Salmonella enterica]ERN62291.1 hypothetical protein SEEK9166_15715 [Salmonella enterica subsp. enterica serovar Kentucky str. 29166]
MSDPVRITNPGAESLGYDSDGHEIMAVDIYVNPPRVDVFHGTPPAWSSFGNKTIWGGNEWVDDSPTRSDIEKRDKEITAYKNARSARSRKRMRISVLKLENASLRQLLQGKKMKTH